MNIDENTSSIDKNSSFNLCDQWILNRLNEVIVSVNENMEKFEFVNVGSELYNFIWNDFCSWYIELAKVHINSENEAEKSITKETLTHTLNAVVRLLHPFMPFVSEEIYQSLPNTEESICIAKWPEFEQWAKNDTINDQFQYLFDIVKGIRNIRSQYTIKNSIEIAYTIQTKDNQLAQFLQELSPYIYKLCHAKCIGYNVECSENVATEMIKGGHALIVELGIISI